jgi:hypothetical protein
MNNDEATEVCAKAIAKIHGYNEKNWKDTPNFINRAADIIAALEALGLFKPTEEKGLQITNQTKRRGRL